VAEPWPPVPLKPPMLTVPPAVLPKLPNGFFGSTVVLLLGRDSETGYDAIYLRYDIF
jgi:hypothetical protein